LAAGAEEGPERGGERKAAREGGGRAEEKEP